MLITQQEGCIILISPPTNLCFFHCEVGKKLIPCAPHSYHNEEWLGLRVSLINPWKPRLFLLGEKCTEKWESVRME